MRAAFSRENDNSSEIANYQRTVLESRSGNADVGNNLLRIRIYFSRALSDFLPFAFELSALSFQHAMCSDLCPIAIPCNPEL